MRTPLPSQHSNERAPHSDAAKKGGHTVREEPARHSTIGEISPTYNQHLTADSVHQKADRPFAMDALNGCACRETHSDMTPSSQHTRPQKINKTTTTGHAKHTHSSTRRRQADRHTVRGRETARRNINAG
mmetsp:Transcript_27593/g.68789  ORF Transcript_27593/g.68789 Transcript_27593/m.68789 type:complete len:130 (-) Transcript_27593:131-520(-)